MGYFFRFTGRVGRREYVRAGVALACVKYLGDLTLIWFGAHQLWLPQDYLTSAPFGLTRRLDDPSPWLLVALAAWTLPFVWIGISMTARRAIDAGRSAWFAPLFLVPYVNYVLMAVMCLAPTASATAPPLRKPIDLAPSSLGEAVISMFAGTVVGLGMIFVALSIMPLLGVALFFGTPFVMGALTGFLYNRRQQATALQTGGVVLLMFLGVAAVTLAVGWDGALCIVMALPIALVAGWLGALMGRGIARGPGGTVPPAVATMLVLPLWLAVEPPPARHQSMHEVQTSVEIAAPPDAVWPHVIAFAPIPEPDDLIFRLGVAYPQRADLAGTGVGAIRYCRFSTGAFVEPITRWEPGRRLSFDVTESPAPMRELSPYPGIHPPHLDGILRSRRGEFRLVALSNGRTRLEGSTWYEVAMAPEGYWQAISDALIHRIHARVLDHIKQEAEGASRSIGGRE